MTLEDARREAQHDADHFGSPFWIYSRADRLDWDGDVVSEWGTTSRRDVATEARRQGGDVIEVIPAPRGR